MKKLLLLIQLIVLPIFLSAQVVNASLMHDDIERDYIIYLPENYTGDSPVPLVLNFHGYGSNAFEQLLYGDFRAIADTEGFIVVHPNGTLLEGTTHWNVGGWTLGSTTDDIGFTESLIDQLASEYNINLDRVYATGMSNGGYMSFLLACQLSDKIAAVASVTGAMTPETFQLCNANRPVPMLSIHGTEDLTVPYSGAAWTIGIADVLNYWVEHNGTSTEASIMPIEDVDTNDGSTVEHFVYADGENGSTVEHFKITGGGHTWPGSAISFGGTNQDINASQEVWNFFARYDLNGLLMTNADDLGQAQKVSVYPNPVNSMLRIEHPNVHKQAYEIYNTLGQLVQTGLLDLHASDINIKDLKSNIYFLKIDNQAIKLIKQ